MSHCNFGTPQLTNCELYTFICYGSLNDCIILPIQGARAILQSPCMSVCLCVCLSVCLSVCLFCSRYLDIITCTCSVYPLFRIRSYLLRVTNWLNYYLGGGNFRNWFLSLYKKGCFDIWNILLCHYDLYHNSVPLSQVWQFQDFTYYPLFWRWYNVWFTSSYIALNDICFSNTQVRPEWNSVLHRHHPDST